MADLSGIRDGLRARLATIAGLRAHATWPDQITCPAAIVRPSGMDYHESLSGKCALTFDVLLLAAPIQPGLDRAQKALDGYLDDSGPTSVKAAIEADGTLGGVADDLVVTGWRDYGSLEVNGTDYLGVRIEVQVWA